jgi:ATP-dependent protease ClpP protease subunit
MNDYDGRRLICEGALVLYGDVGEAGWADVDGFTASDVLFALAEIGADRDVTVRINSGGGNAFEGLAIHAILSAHRGKITTVVEGIAASAASIIAMAGKDRIVAPGSLMMIHDPSGLTVGTADDHDDTAAMLRTLSDALATVYATATGRAKAVILEEMKAETWLDADESLARRYATAIGTAPASTAMLPFPFGAYAKAPAHLVALAETKGWSARQFTASHALGKSRSERHAAAPRSFDKAATASAPDAIAQTCALAGCPERAAEFIAAGASSADVAKQLLAEAVTGTATQGASQNRLSRADSASVATLCLDASIPEMTPTILARATTVDQAKALIQTGTEMKDVVTLARRHCPSVPEDLAVTAFAAGKTVKQVRDEAVNLMAEEGDRTEVQGSRHPAAINSGPGAAKRNMLAQLARATR